MKTTKKIEANSKLDDVGKCEVSTRGAHGMATNSCITYEFDDIKQATLLHLISTCVSPEPTLTRQGRYRIKRVDLVVRQLEKQHLQWQAGGLMKGMCASRPTTTAAGKRKRS